MFWKKVVYQMVMNNEALVIMQNDEFYLAESFTRTTGAFVENIYSDIVIENYTIKESKKESEVFYFTLNNADIERVVSNFYSDYSKLIELNIKAFKSNNTKKGTLEIPTSYPQTELAQGKLKELINERFKEYLNSETNAVLPLTNGLKFVEAGGSSYKTTNTTNRETRELINDLIDLFGMAFNVPPNLLKGTITDASGDINLFITFCINPLAETFSSEINRKYFTREEYLNGDYVRLDTNNIKVTDLKDIAGSLDILTRIGAFNINDSLRKLGMKTLNDDFAKVHFITKNYEPVQHMIDNPEGNKEGNIQTNIAEGGE
jgi:HK97 family phage portal protein